MDCLVTGGAGFIGSHVVDALLDRGDRVTVIDNLSSGKRSKIEAALDRGADLHVADVTDTTAVTDIFAITRPELVFHLAAQIDVRASVRQPGLDAAVNVLGTITVLQAARAVNSRRIVNSSTGGGLYGDADILPTRETHAIRPLAPYGQSKHAGEGYCELYTRLHGLSTVSLRYGNVYGPRQDVQGEAGVVAIFCGHLVDRTRPTIYGDGKQTRDWIEVSDVVRANLLAARSDVVGPINIGHGNETSVLELLAALNEISESGSMAQPQSAPQRPGEVRRSSLDVSRAYDELGWKAEIELRDGLRRVVAGFEATGIPSPDAAVKVPCIMPRQGASSDADMRP